MISDKPHPEDPAARCVTWNTKAMVTGYGTEPEPYLILRVDTGKITQYIHVPMATYEAVSEWPMRSTVNLRLEMDNRA